MIDDRGGTNAERRDMTHHKTRLDGAHCTGRGDAKHAAECHGRSQAGEEQEEHRGQHLFNQQQHQTTEVSTCDLQS